MTFVDAVRSARNTQQRHQTVLISVRKDQLRSAAMSCSMRGNRRTEQMADG